MSKFKKGIAVCSLVLAWAIAMMGVATYAVKQHAKETVAETYVICDVVSTNWDNSSITVEMQNGELHEYVADDLPEECEVVCFKANDLEDYTTYEIVAVR